MHCMQELTPISVSRILTLRPDRVTEENDVKLVLSTATLKEEDFYIAPPGNIPLISRDLKGLK